MPNDAYDFRIHTHVAIPGALRGLHPIVHAPKGRVWILVSYCDDLPEGALPVGDGQSDGYDQWGQRLVSLPGLMCRFYTEREAEQAEAMADADERLLSYAN